MTPSRAASRTTAASPATWVALATTLVKSVPGRDSAAPKRFEPVTTTWTVLPRVPLVGAIEVAATWPVTNTPVLLPLPPPCVTLIGPLVVPPGTVAVSVVAVAVWTVPATPLKNTVLLLGVVSSKDWPKIVTVAPAGPKAGLKPLTTGGSGLMVRVTVAVPSAPAMVSVVGPRGASALTTRSNVRESTSARTFWIVTPDTEVVTDAPARFEPLTVTVVVETRLALEADTDPAVVVCGTALSRVILRMFPTESE